MSSDVPPQHGATTAVSHGGRLSGLLRAARPKQWVKNLLVFAAPVAAGQLLNPDVFAASIVAFIAFIFASAAVYLVNDVKDAPEDRIHPEKRHRPIASGAVSPRLALLTAAILVLFSIAGPLLLGYVDLVILLISYVVIQAVYQVWGKHQAVIDLAFVASGFVLRGVAGGVAAGIFPSSWFLVVIAAVAMFIVSGKRYSELVNQEDRDTRAVLSRYSLDYRRFVWGVSVGVAVTSYFLWSVELSSSGNGWAAQLSAVPFTLILLRYAQDIDRGHAEAPEDVLQKDGVILILGMVWALLFVIQSLT